MSNKDLYERYMNKCKLLGVDNKLKFRLIGETIEFIGLEDSDGVRELVIPSFVTKIKENSLIDEEIEEIYIYR